MICWRYWVILAVLFPGYQCRDSDADRTIEACNDILLLETPEERCIHAKKCDGELILKTLLPRYFCRGEETSPLDSFVVFPASVGVLTLLLFRLLGSTAEDYFSPALEMIATEFDIVSLDHRCDDYLMTSRLSTISLAATSGRGDSFGIGKRSTRCQCRSECYKGKPRRGSAP